MLCTVCAVECGGHLAPGWSPLSVDAPSLPFSRANTLVDHRVYYVHSHGGDWKTDRMSGLIVEEILLYAIPASVRGRTALWVGRYVTDSTPIWHCDTILYYVTIQIDHMTAVHRVC
jgi:hypothetical protein